MALWMEMTNGAGGGGGYQLLKTGATRFTSKTGTITGLTAGKEYMLIMSFGWSNTNFAAQISTATNTTNLTTVDYGKEAVGPQYCNTLWSVYTFTATGTSTEITLSNMSSSASDIRYFLFEKA